MQFSTLVEDGQRIRFIPNRTNKYERAESFESPHDQWPLKFWGNSTLHDIMLIGGRDDVGPYITVIESPTEMVPPDSA